MATVEEAQKCPRCSQPGEPGTQRSHPDKPGYKLLTVTCRNPVCPWLDTGYVIMINPDGSVPDPAPAGTARGSKVYGDPITGEGKSQSAGISTSMIEKINRQISQFQQNREI
jgi:hypothetical protein